MDQDSRFADKQKKLMKSMNFPKVYNSKVDMKKVKLEAMKPWITKKVVEIVGLDDDLVVGYVFELLEAEKVDPKDLHINLTGFLEGKTQMFVEQLWILLLSAQSSPYGIPQQFLDEKKMEIIRSRAEADKLANDKAKMTEKAKDIECRQSTKGPERMDLWGGIRVRPWTATVNVTTIETAAAGTVIGIARGIVITTDSVKENGVIATARGEIVTRTRTGAATGPATIGTAIATGTSTIVVTATAIVTGATGTVRIRTAAGIGIGTTTAIWTGGNANAVGETTGLALKRTGTGGTATELVMGAGSRGKVTSRGVGMEDVVVRETGSRKRTDMGITGSVTRSISEIMSMSTKKRATFVAETGAGDGGLPAEALDEQQQDQLIEDIKLKNDIANSSFKMLLSILSSFLSIFFLALSAVSAVSLHDPLGAEVSTPHALACLASAAGVALTTVSLHAATPEIPFVRKEGAPTGAATPPAIVLALAKYAVPLQVASIAASAVPLLLLWLWHEGVFKGEHGVGGWGVLILYSSPLGLALVVLSVMKSVKDVDAGLVTLEGSRYKLKGA
ncbi:Serine/arginine repetitive matrix protein 1 [Irineochytrium annulatum]|nr:Serine/arginine repetitive matrix protein 1 [Irineochytrium annulatum]